MSRRSRPTRSGITHAVAECKECGWSVDSRNALGLAAQHYDHTGHVVNAEQVISVTYGTKVGKKAP